MFVFFLLRFLFVVILSLLSSSLLFFFRLHASCVLLLKKKNNNSTMQQNANDLCAGKDTLIHTHQSESYCTHIIALLPCATKCPLIDRQYATNEGVECVFLSFSIFLEIFLHTSHKYFA